MHELVYTHLRYVLITSQTYLKRPPVFRFSCLHFAEKIIALQQTTLSGMNIEHLLEDSWEVKKDATNYDYYSSLENIKHICCFLD